MREPAESKRDRSKRKRSRAASETCRSQGERRTQMLQKSLFFFFRFHDQSAGIGYGGHLHFFQRPCSTVPVHCMPPSLATAVSVPFDSLHKLFTLFARLPFFSFSSSVTYQENRRVHAFLFSLFPAHDLWFKSSRPVSNSLCRLRGVSLCSIRLNV